MLVEKGHADCTLQDYYSDDAFDCAALVASDEIVEYFVKQFGPSAGDSSATSSGLDTSRSNAKTPTQEDVAKGASACPSKTATYSAHAQELVVLSDKKLVRVCLFFSLFKFYFILLYFIFLACLFNYFLFFSFLLFS